MNGPCIFTSSGWAPTTQTSQRHSTISLQATSNKVRRANCCRHPFFFSHKLFSFKNTGKFKKAEMLYKQVLMQAHEREFGPLEEGGNSQVCA